MAPWLSVLSWSWSRDRPEQAAQEAQCGQPPRTPVTLNDQPAAAAQTPKWLPTGSQAQV